MRRAVCSESHSQQRVKPGLQRRPMPRAPAPACQAVWLPKTQREVNQSRVQQLMTPESFLGRSDSQVKPAERLLRRYTSDFHSSGFSGRHVYLHDTRCNCSMVRECGLSDFSPITEFPAQHTLRRSHVFMVAEQKCVPPTPSPQRGRWIPRLLREVR